MQGSAIAILLFLSGSAAGNDGLLLRTFGGFRCIPDCTSLAAGYLWAEKKDVESARDCPPGASDGFYRGCIVFIRDPDRGATEDDGGVSIDAAGTRPAS
jgi:hypothetical protein